MLDITKEFKDKVIKALLLQRKNFDGTDEKFVKLPYLGNKTQTSCKRGVVKLQGMDCLLGDDGEIYFGERLIRLMELVEGRQLDVYWLDANDGTVIKALVYLRGETQLICELLPKPTYSWSKIGRTPNDNANRELMSKYVNTIDGFMKKTQKRNRKFIDKR